MSKEVETKDGHIYPLEEKINRLKPEDFKKALQIFKEKINHEYAAYLNSCVHCGLCADSCHYFLTYSDIKSIPAYKLDLIVSIFKGVAPPTYDATHPTEESKYRGKVWFLGSLFQGIKKKGVAPPTHDASQSAKKSRKSGNVRFFRELYSKIVGAKDFNHQMVREWVDSLYGRCSMCGRCSINCSIGLNIAYLIRMARGVLTAIGLTPPGLKSTVDTAIEKGNNMGIPKEDWIETVEWLEEEFQDEVDDPGATFPIDKKGAALFYTVNPREPMFFPLSISAVGKIFYAAKESWTFSSGNYDVTNYGLYDGNDKGAGIMSNRLVQSMEELGCKTLVLAECGHGYNSNRWEAPEWLRKKYGFEVKSILEIVADYIREGRIKLEPSLNEKPITIHDPCNLVRLGGIVETQRYILKHAAKNVIEMIPNRQKNFCCGGGGGQLAMTHFSERRLKVGKIKADQIKETGAKIVATPCHNCIDQLMELNKHHKLGVEIKTICEIVANAIVI